MQLTIWKFIFACVLLVYPIIGLSYVGPGLGTGAIVLILGILGSIVLALFAVFWYPIKRLLQRRKQKRAGESKPADDQSQAED